MYLDPSVRHNSHTHTDNTRQPKSQLKSSSCSSVIPSHNSRYAISRHNSRNATCLILIPSHNSRDMFRATTQGTLQVHLRGISKALQITHTHSNQNIVSASVISPGTALEPPSETRFQTAQRETRAAKRQTPRSPLIYKHRLAETNTARHYINTCVVLVFVRHYKPLFHTFPKSLQTYLPSELGDSIMLCYSYTTISSFST